MKTMNYRDFIDMIYGHCFDEDFSKYQLAHDVDICDLFIEVVELVTENVSMTGCELGLYLPSGVYLPSGEIAEEAQKKMEEIERLRKSLKEAEQSFQEALINSGPFYRGKHDDDYDDCDYDDDYDDDDDDCDYDDDDDDY